MTTPAPTVRVSTFTCAVALLFVWASLRLVGFGRTLSLLRRRAATPRRQGDFGPLVDSATRRMAKIAAFLPVRVACLEQSLALFACLRRRGVPVTVCMGVQPYRFRAHAWLEYDSHPVLELDESVRGVVAFPPVLV